MKDIRTCLDPLPSHEVTGEPRKAFTEGVPRPGTPTSLLLYLCPVSTILNVSSFQVGDLEENTSQKSKWQRARGSDFRSVQRGRGPL